MSIENCNEDIKTLLADQKTAIEDLKTVLEDLVTKVDGLSRPETCEGHHNGTVLLRSGMEVVCNGSWIVIQRRMSAKVSFNRKWKEYKNGFGDWQGNFWYGLERMHQLTSQRRYEVRFEFTYKGKNYYARYSTFSVARESDNYRLNISGYDASSTAGDRGHGMSYHNGMEFSTPDRDNDNCNDCNCARESAWWFSKCGYVNFNGKWGVKYFGVKWYYEAGPNSVTSVVIKMRPL